MTMLEKKMNSIIKEIEKLEKSLATHETRLAKKIAKAEKVNANWTRDEFFQHRDTDMTDDQWSAYFDMNCERREVEDITRRLENAHSRLNKVSPKVESQIAEMESEKEFTEKANRIETHWISAEEQKKAYEKWLAEFKSECAKDGVIIDEAYRNFVNGTTPNGKHFYIEINNGFTERSFYCYTLKINGETIFTSGTFTTAYSTIIKA